MAGVSGPAQFTFALPPSLGRESVKQLARGFADVLYAGGFSTVLPGHDYAELEQLLSTGQAQAGWAPPIVCARVEQAGGAVLLRAVRNGATSYRSVLLCRSEHVLDFKRLGAPGGRKLRAVWVDPRSMGGCILARHHLRSRGVDLAAAFEDERMLGSYQACFDAVLERRADITASFAGPRGLGFVELCGDRAMQLRQLAYTGESPNDAVVLSAGLAPDVSADLAARLRRLFGTRQTLELLADLFDVNGFDQPPTRSYQPLLDLL
jgi:ABC-type phosphate/phosphonate transport system substrate-binding protein